MTTMPLMALVALQAAAQSEPPQSPPALSLCEVIANDPTKLNGKVIKTSGLFGSTDEGMWLIGECQTHLVTKGLTWANGLSVYVDESDENIARSWEKMGRKLRQLHADSRRDRIWITVVGRLETRASMDDEVVQMPYGLRKAAFGHLGESPAEINVISVEKVSAERQSPDTKNLKSRVPR